jgi:hypothetical protein
MATSDRFSSLALPLDYSTEGDRFQTGTGDLLKAAAQRYRSRVSSH